MYVVGPQGKENLEGVELTCTTWKDNKYCPKTTSSSNIFSCFQSLHRNILCLLH